MAGDVSGFGVVISDEDAFAAFYRSEWSAVVRLAWTLTGRYDLAEELAQEAFLAAHRRWSRISRYEDPGGWVRRVVTNRCVSARRRRLTEARLMVRLGQERPAQQVLSGEAEDLWAAVRSLPKRQAQVSALVFLEDRSVPDVARLLACGQGTVRTHLQRGRRAIAARLAEEEQGS